MKGAYMDCANKSEANGEFYCTTAEYEECGGKSCPFYITEKDAASSLNKAHARIRTLPDIDQRNIADTYYKGAMPWKK